MNDEHKELRQEIAKVIRSFSMNPHLSPLKKQKDREQAGRFIDRIHSSTFDTASLPYYSKNGLAEHRNKGECVLALICDVVLTYWCIAADNIAGLTGTGCIPEDVTSRLKRLNTVLTNYDSLPVLGDIKGYCLFEAQREDLYGSKKIKSKSVSEEVSQAKNDEGTDSTDKREKAQVSYSDLDIDPEIDFGGDETAVNLVDKAIQDNLPELPELEDTDAASTTDTE